MALTRHTNASLYQRACRVMPGGVSSPVRTYEAIGGTPPVIQRADGATVTDVEGTTYVDLVSAYGAILLGHGHDRVAAACHRAATHGLNTATPHPEEIRLAERLTEAHPGLAWLRFVNSGTEAVMSALRLARGATGRDLIVTFEGCYHGHWDPLLVKAGSGAGVFASGKSAGVPVTITAHTVVLPLDDAETLDAFFDDHGHEVAAAIIEPVPANSGLLPQRPAFLERLQARCQEAGALFVADEIVTGTRLGPGGASQRFGLDPDLVTIGKTIGGGLPIGAYGGRAELRDLVAPEGPVYQAGTASGNAIAMAAGNAVLDVLDQNPHRLDRLHHRVHRFAQAATKVLAPAGARIHATGPIAWLTFHPDPRPRKAGTLTDTHREAFARLHRAAREQGVLLPPSPVESLFPTLAHADDVLDTVVERLARVADDLEVSA